MTSTTALRKSPVLLLGGAGHLGAMLTRFWPVRTDLRVQSRRAGQADVCFDPLVDHQALGKAAQDVRAVICLAGVTQAHATQTGDAMALNAALALAAIAAAPKGVRVFLASSAAVYGAAVFGEAAGLCSEDAVCDPISEYGRAKLAMEQVGLAQDHPVTALRIGNVAGADAILGGWEAGMQIDAVPGAGTPRRSYIGPKTLARVLHRLTLVENVPGVLNIAAPGAVAMGELLDAAGLGWTPRPAGKGMIPVVELDTRRLENHVDFGPEDSSAAGLVAQWHELKDRT